MLPCDFTLTGIVSIGATALVTASFCWRLGVVQLNPKLEQAVVQSPLVTDVHKEHAGYAKVNVAMAMWFGLVP